MANRDQPMSPDTAERLQLRRENIEFLMRLEFPLSNAPPPISTISASQASIETSRANQNEWQAGQNTQRARRAELWKMTDEHLDALVKQVRARERERDRIRREKLTPLAVEPDWQFWAYEDEWELHDAALLLVNLEPREGLGLHLKKMMRGEYDDGRYVRAEQTPEGLSDEARTKLDTTQQIFRRANVAYGNGKLAVEFSRGIGSNRQYGAVEPRPFLLWAGGKAYEVPNVLRALTGDAEKQRQAGRTSEKATKASAEKRRSRNVERDRRIHDAAAAGKKPKQIGADRSIVGDEGLSASHIRKILQSPRP